MSNYTLIQWNDTEDQVLNDATKYKVLKQNVTEPSTGLDPGLEYFVNDIPYPAPEIDDRLVYQVSTKTMLDEVDENGYRKMQTLYSSADRTIEEKETAIDDEEVLQNSTIISTAEQIKYIFIYAAAIRIENKGLDICPEMQCKLDEIDIKALMIFKNHIESLAKKACLADGDEINIDEGWNCGDDYFCEISEDETDTE